MMKSLAFFLQIPFSRRQHKARAGRDDVTRERFIAALAADDVEMLAAGILWDKLVEVAVVPDFRPEPEDDFTYLYGLADEDLDEDIIMGLLNELELPLPSIKTVGGIGPIKSPRLLMSLVGAARRAANGSKN
jgi:hypothetical protein